MTASLPFAQSLEPSWGCTLARNCRNGSYSLNHFTPRSSYKPPFFIVFVLSHRDGNPLGFRLARLFGSFKRSTV